MTSKELLTVTQVMVLLKVSRMTVHRRVKSGKLKPVNTPSTALERNANMRFKREDVEALLHSEPSEEEDEAQDRVA